MTAPSIDAETIEAVGAPEAEAPADDADQEPADDATEPAGEQPAQPVADDAGYSRSPRVLAGGIAYTLTPCPLCGMTQLFAVETGAEVKVTDDGERMLKPTFKAQARSHRCGQMTLPLKDVADGQTEAFPADGEQLTPGSVGELLDQVADILSDDPAIDLPPDEEIAAWPPETLTEVTAWARAVIDGTEPRPELPSVLAVQPDEQDSTAP